MNEWLGVAPAELGDVVDALDKALTVDFGLFDPEVLAGLLPTMNLLRAKVDALDARFVDAIDDPRVWGVRRHSSVTAMLRANSNGHPGDATGRGSRARRLTKMPLTAEAFEDGLITRDHVRLLGQLTERRYGRGFVDAEAYLVDAAKSMCWADFVKVINAWKTAADLTEADLSDQADEDAREVFLSTSFNHRGYLKGTLTPQCRVKFGRMLDRITRRLLHEDRADAKARLGKATVTAADLARTPAQRRHDALEVMAEMANSAEPGAKIDPLVSVRMSEPCLEAAALWVLGIEPDPVAPEDWLCEYDDGTPMSYTTAMRHVVAGKIHAVVHNQTGEVLHYGKGREWFTPGQIRAIRDRDPVCVCGCGLLAEFCDIDHIVERADGGYTDVENGQPRCRRSHSLKTGQNITRRAIERALRDGPEHPWLPTPPTIAAHQATLIAEYRNQTCRPPQV